MLRENTTKHNMPPARPRKIALLSHVMARNGAPIALLSVAKMLKDAGWQVDVFSVVHGPLEEEFGTLGIDVKVDGRLHATPLAHQPWYKDYDLFFVNTAVMAGCFAVPLNGVPAVWWIHEGTADIPQNYALIEELTSEGLREYRTYWRYKMIIATMKRKEEEAKSKV